VRQLLCASPDYLATHGEPRHPSELKQHRLIASAEHVHWDFPGYLLKARARLSCSTVQGAINAAVQGAGVVRCLSYPLHGPLGSGQLRRILPAYEGPPLPVNVVYREGRNAPMRVRSFVDHCVAALREHPAFQLA
jgi:DNA-binding transcriptional LysR family regulator